MERNYFLSYGHKITLLLLLAAVGKINAKFIPVVMSKTGLLYCTAINNHPQRCLADVSVHLSEAGNKMSAVQNGAYAFCSSSPHHNFPFFNHKSIQSFFFRDIQFVAVWSKWTNSYPGSRENIFLIFNEVQKFYINSLKLVDGFKFIIKIPDKIIHSLIP